MMSAGVFGLNSQPLYQPQGGVSAFNLDGVFDDAYTALSIEGEEPAYSTFKPVLGVRLAQFPAGVTPQAGDSVTIYFDKGGSNLFKVMNVRTDGKGWAKLELMTTTA